MLPELESQLADEMAQACASDRFRVCPPLTTDTTPYVSLAGRRLVGFCSNDYLALAQHPAVLAALAQATAGATASRLVAGDTTIHRTLETKLASFLETPATLIFPSGYQANLGVLTALAGPDDLIVSDALNHASLIDGCRLSRARIAIYPHRDTAAAFRLLATSTARRRFLVTESIFSMDGDTAPIVELAQAARDTRAALIVDEAHALGLIGPRGRGLCAQHDVKPDILIGTLGKAFGSAGGFAAGSTLLISYLTNRARTFIFTTGLFPAAAAAAAAALDLAMSSEGDRRRQHLASLAKNLRAQLKAPPGEGPIVPVILGSDAQALRASSTLQTAGFFVQAIRPPTVPEGTSRLRITLSAAHTVDQVNALALAVIGCATPTPSHSQSGPIRPKRLQGLLIVGTDTGVGKTTVAQALLRLAHRAGRPFTPLKPVETGVPMDSDPPDARALLLASGILDLHLDQVCPYRSSLAVAPAADPYLQLTPSDLVHAVHNAARSGRPVLVEGAGGLLSPYTETFTAADLATKTGLKVLLVGRNTLGTINHTTLALAEISRRGLRLAGLVLTNVTAETTIDQATNAALITAQTGIVPLATLPFIANPTPDTLADAFVAQLKPETVAALFDAASR